MKDFVDAVWSLTLIGLGIGLVLGIPAAIIASIFRLIER